MNNLNSGGGSVHDVEYVISHENYGDFKNDVALIKIKGEFKLDESRKIIELNTNQIPKNANVVISGWGRVATGGGLPINLKWNILQKLSSASCNVIVGLNKDLICLGHSPNQGACNGDSGNSKLTNSQKTFY